jgi:pimeloyl-ACP methyl ester carboxylesterase
MNRRDVIVSAAAGASAMSSGALAVPQALPSHSARQLHAADGALLFHREVGSGRPVLFVHAATLSSNMWAYQMAYLADHGFRCIAYDRRGHGRSDSPGGPFTMDVLADDLASVMQQMALRDVVLVGHSAGANEIIRYIGKYGSDKVGRVALLAPTTPFALKTEDNPHGAPAAYFEQLRAAWAKDFPNWVEDNKLPFFTPDTSPAMMTWLVNELLRTPVSIAIAMNRAAVECDLRPDLAKVDRPVLILHGDKDTSAPLEMTGRRTASGIKDAVLKVYPGAPHGLFVTHKEQVNQDLLEFAQGAKAAL